MDIAIGLPATIPGTTGAQLVDWAKRADTGPFSSLGVIDRLVFPNLDSLLALTAAAAVTERIRLTTTVLLATTRNTGVLAKEAASLDVLSNGRLTLGLGVGAREDDFHFVHVAFRGRGERFDQQLDELHRIWAGETLHGAGVAGPKPVQPGGPPILIGGYTPRAIARLSKWGIGFIAGGLHPERTRAVFDLAEQSWKAGGRAGKPHLVASAYFALGDDGRNRGGEYLRAYYGPEMGNGIARSMPVTPEAIKEVIISFREVGADELFLWPTISDVGQVDRLAAIVS